MSLNGASMKAFREFEQLEGALLMIHYRPPKNRSPGDCTLHREADHQQNPTERCFPLLGMSEIRATMVVFKEFEVLVLLLILFSAIQKSSQ